MRVRFEPLGFELDCAPGESILDAGFRNGYNLVYGCREGQCSACKCFLLEGDVSLKPYSTFALSDSERSSGYSLMCRAMPDEDVVVELLHYDPEDYRLAHPIRDWTAAVSEVEELTHDIVRVVLRVSEEFDFTPGQYVDVWVPGLDGERRSFSMANLPGDGQIELVIKRYPGGRFSGLLGSGVQVGSSLSLTGPYGSLRVRESSRPILMIAGGSGMAPIVSLLRALSDAGCPRPVRFFYGSRTQDDLFWVSEIEALGSALPDFRFIPVVGGFVHEAVDEFLAGADAPPDPDVYMCGPPPMVEAAEAMLAGRGVDEQRIFVDKFTTSASASAVEPAATDGAASEAAASEAAASERDFAWFAPAGRRPTLYEDVTVDTQPSVHRHLTRGWPLSFEDGRGTWNDDSTALRCTDWFAFRDPDEQWERPFYQRGSAAEREIEAAIASAVSDGLLGDFSPEWVEFLRSTLQVPAYVEHGLWFALATIARDCLSDSVATCVCLQAAMKQRSAQAIVLYAMDLERAHGEFSIERARSAFLDDAAWQPARRFVERLAGCADWGEVLIATNLCFEPVFGTLLRREVGIRAAAAAGDTVTPVLARAASREWEWVRGWTVSLVRMLVSDSSFGEANRELIQSWVAGWLPQALSAAEAVAGLVPVGPDAVARVTGEAESLLAECLSDRAARAARAPRAPREPTRRTRGAPLSRSKSASAGGEHDYVGIVMARSAEGDAVADALRPRDGVEVLEQPSFWEIRAPNRLSIQFHEVSEQLGYEIDAYSIQREMSTHYGRMITTDDALMLFADPAEAMAHLMS